MDPEVVKYRDVKRAEHYIRDAVARADAATALAPQLTETLREAVGYERAEAEAGR